jgi:hypothetical protein
MFLMLIFVFTVSSVNKGLWWLAAAECQPICWHVLSSTTNCFCPSNICIWYVVIQWLVAFTWCSESYLILMQNIKLVHFMLTGFRGTQPATNAFVSDQSFNSVFGGTENSSGKWWLQIKETKEGTEFEYPSSLYLILGWIFHLLNTA